jgi:hypothetical protein
VGVEAAKTDVFLRLSDGLRELEVVIGPKARPVIAELRTRLAEASALRSGGNISAALDTIRGAMDKMAVLLGDLDPAEAMLMRMLTQQFSSALGLGDKGAAKEAVNVMRHKAGGPKDDPNSDW